MQSVLAGAGWFLLPLGICSVLAVYIIVERLLALRPARVLPAALIEAFLSGRVDALAADGLERSVAGRIVAFQRSHRPDPDALKAFAMLEITRMERGIFALDVVVAGAPLIGLLGTVTGLVHVFGGIDVGGGLPESNVFTQGIALALSTTMLGLMIAIPALVASGYLYRRIDMLSAQLNVGVERLIDLMLSGAATASIPEANITGTNTSPAITPEANALPANTSPANVPASAAGSSYPASGADRRYAPKAD